MGLNETPSANRVHIGFFGRRNAGKSSLLNAVTGQDLAVVSEVKGTTTDPVYKAMELLPMGPVLIIDTPGIDDEGSLGELRVRKARQVLNKTDVAVLVVDASEEGRGARPGDSGGVLFPVELELVDIFRAKGVPFIIAWNKIDALGQDAPPPAIPNAELIACSARAGKNIKELKERIAVLAVTEDAKLRIVGDLLHPSDFAVLVTPIDKAAPKGRLILPQQQTIRDILEADAAALVVKEHELRDALAALGKKPAIVITDSQVFAKVSADVPPDIPLTSFSILFSRYKGTLEASVRGVLPMDALKTGDKVLVCEGCTHHRQCDDIGTVKLPRWVKNYTSTEPEFCFNSGGDFPDDLSPYKMVIHCGGCMLNEREMNYRARCAADQNIPFTNYGIVIAHMQGILRRSIAMFPHIASQLEE
ncbi:MAG: [FeFe] hydrogenase H-cluster maturation GTPase HydF [Spirochaetaceae bacterium]|jgi:[FeFe] hydrogenase H-cluster maturation GTPase HydF|nr:[FeFe] hydrogenase H-cluster maturation GTPase HydF [Spirochaetaceae bacterium]